jgi:hypothetical protein
MELGRSSCEQWCVQLFNEQSVTARDFEITSEGACYLKKAGRQKFYEAWAGRQPVVGRLMRSYARAWLRIMDASAHA